MYKYLGLNSVYDIIYILLQLYIEGNFHHDTLGVPSVDGNFPLDKHRVVSLDNTKFCMNDGSGDVNNTNPSGSANQTTYGLGAPSNVNHTNSSGSRDVSSNVYNTPGSANQGS